MSAVTYAKLGDVAQYLRGINFKPDDVVAVGTAGTVACMRTKNIQESLDCADVWGVAETFVRRPEQILQEGDLLVSSANSWNLVGKCCWIPKLPWKSTFGGFVSALRADPQKINPRFLYWWFSSDRTQALLRSFGQKTTSISNLNAERCLNLDVPLPALAEQRRIAAILDQADALRTKRREALAQLDSLTQSIFMDMFGDPVTNPHGLKKLPLASVTEISTGSTPSRSEKSYYEGSIPWVKTTEVVGEPIFDTEEKLTEIGLRAIRGKLHPVGSIMVAMYGQGQTRGRSGLLAIEAACNQACGVVRPSEKFDSLFMFSQLQSAYERLRALGRGGNQENLNLQLLGSFEVLLPPLSAQHTFTNRIGAVEVIKTKQRVALAELDALFASLQHRAFQGEL